MSFGKWRPFCPGLNVITEDHEKYGWAYWNGVFDTEIDLSSGCPSPTSSCFFFIKFTVANLFAGRVSADLNVRHTDQ